MSLPPQQQQETYTQDEVQHIVAREMAKQQIVQLQNGQLEVNKKLVEMTATFTAELANIAKIIQQTPDRIEACKVEFRQEIEKDFPSRIEAIQMESRIEGKIKEVDNKVERQWIKITVVLGTLSAVITGLGVAMNYYLMVAKLAN